VLRNLGCIAVWSCVLCTDYAFLIETNDCVLREFGPWKYGGISEVLALGGLMKFWYGMFRYKFFAVIDWAEGRLRARSMKHTVSNPIKHQHSDPW
jgi:hypothetical protein